VRSGWVTGVAVVVALVAVGAITLGLASSRGPRTPGGAEPAAAATTPPSTTGAPTSTPTEEADPGATAPASVRGVWPGRPPAAEVDDDGDVDWCPAVDVAPTSGATRTFGAEAVRAGACEAVAFVLDRRYSRLSLPRESYEASDFDDAADALTGRTADAVYRPRVRAFVARPDAKGAREALGLVLFTGDGTSDGDPHARAGLGRVFYGPPFTADGYRDRAVWINPSWSTVKVSVDGSATPRLVAEFTASASVPVLDPASGDDDMLTVPTTARFTLRGGDDWAIDSWSIRTGRSTVSPLEVG
jgi:hypothetical protein